jgi:hypothetical protein
MAFACATAAHSATFRITYKGVIESGAYDTYGAFGPTHSIEGADFAAVYTLTIPTPLAQLSSGAGIAAIQGGSSLGPGVGSPVVGALTINGATWAFGATQFFGSAMQSDRFPSLDFDRVGHAITDKLTTPTRQFDQHMSSFIQSYVNNIVDDTDYTHPLFYAYQGNVDGRGGDLNLGDFAISDYDVNAAQFVQSSGGILFARSVRIEAFPSAVPEPATWAVMIIGLAATCLVIRRRKAVIA